MKYFVKKLTIVFGLVTFFISGVNAQIRFISAENLINLNSGPNKNSILIIDLRTNEQYKAGHIPHAINIPTMQIVENAQKLIDWKENPVIVYHDSEKPLEIYQSVTNTLSANGFRNVYCVSEIKMSNHELVTYIDILPEALLQMNSEDDTVLIDARDKYSYDTGHIRGAISIPYGTLSQNLHKLQKNKRYVFYCNTGNRSSKSAKELTELGFSNVFNSILGVLEYNFELVKN